ncbi:MAG: LysE family translocator [Woeseiaceae bacterium]|nr:LysE family translocator [Woeseiaceae bacterium]
MTTSLIALVVATAILVAIPGPNVALIVANSLKNGFRAGVATVVGTTVGVGVQLALVVFGLAAVITLAAEALQWVKWAGVVYLVYLGIRTWREPADDLQAIEAAPAMFWRGFVVAVVNPKTLLFNAAFIPQFVSGDQASLGGLAIVAGVFLAVLSIGDILWAAFASSARAMLKRYAAARNRVTGAFLTAAGIGLAISQR